MDHEGAQRGPGRLAGPAFFLPVACRRRALQKFPAILQSQQEAKRPGLRPFQQAGPQGQIRLGRPSFFGRQRRTHRAGGSGEAVPL